MFLYTRKDGLSDRLGYQRWTYGRHLQAAVRMGIASCDPRSPVWTTQREERLLEQAGSSGSSTVADWDRALCLGR